jgi:hypothetical protein
MVVLPVEPRGPDDEPLICGTCGVEVPDNRLQIAQEQAAAAAAKAAEEEVMSRPENRVYTRGSLLKGLRDAAADRVEKAARDIGSRAKF